MNGRDLETLPPDITDLLAAERRAPPPSLARQARVLSRVQTAVGIGAGAAVSGGGAAAAAGGAKTAGLLTAPVSKLLVVAVAIGTVAAVGVGVGGRAAREDAARHERPVGERPAALAPGPRVEPERWADAPAPVSAVVPPARGAATAAPARVHAPSPARVVDRAPLRAAPPAPTEIAPEVTAADLAAESELLEQARRTLARGESAKAAARAARHAREFPSGLLAEEREAIGIQALVASGDREAARQRALVFRGRFPGSLQNEAVGRALGEIP